MSYLYYLRTTNEGLSAVTVDDILVKIAVAALSGGSSDTPSGPSSISDITNLQSTINGLQDLITSGTNLIANSIQLNSFTKWNGSTYDTPLSVIGGAYIEGGATNTAVGHYTQQKNGPFTITNYANGKYRIIFNTSRPTAMGYIVNITMAMSENSLIRLNCAVRYGSQNTSSCDYLIWRERSGNSNAEDYFNWAHYITITSL